MKTKSLLMMEQQHITVVLHTATLEGKPSKTQCVNMLKQLTLTPADTLSLC